MRPLEVDRRALAADLRAAIEGDVRFDTASRALYATDASNYRQPPIGVVLPRTLEDVVATHRVCREHGAPITPRGCGNGQRTEDEACDDGNKAGGDGCASDCLGIETGYACSPPGKPCRKIARCGDGIVQSGAGEQCDDGNTVSADGCTHDCQNETVQ